ncbi:MAG: hypothetical protein H0W36_03540 [Gemmatimonadetes bacterium]|nr:hypothetical protein [Gemmatimonadota bacterium]
MSIERVLFLCLMLAWPSSGFSQTLRYGGDSGASHVYERTQEDHVRQTVNGQEQNVDIQSYWRLTTHVREATPDAVTFEIVHDSISVVGSPSGDANFSAVYGRSVVLVIGHRGEVRGITVPESLPATAVRLDLETAYRTFFPVLPAQDVKPGVSWSDTLALESNQNGLDLTVRRVNVYTAGGPTEYGERDALQVDYTTTLEMEGSGSQQGAEVSLSGNGSGTGSFFFESDAGLYLGGNESTDVKMDAFIVAGGQNLLIPIVTNRTERVTLIE